METFDLQDDKYEFEIYNEFIEEHNLQNPILQGQEEDAIMILSFDQNDIIEEDIHKVALLHFDMSYVDTTIHSIENRIYITLHF